MTPSYLLTQSAASASAAPPTLNVADSQPSALQHHPFYHTPTAFSGLVTQPTINTDAPQPDLLVNPGFLLPGTHGSHQVTNTVSSAIPDRPSKQTSTAMATHKRKGNSAIETTTTISVSYSTQQANLTPNNSSSRRQRPQQINTDHQSVACGCRHHVHPWFPRDKV